MSVKQQHLYYSQREREARVAADNAIEACARNAHLQMASAYRKLSDLLLPVHVPHRDLHPLPAGDALFARSIEKGIAVIPPPLAPRWIR